MDLEVPREDRGGMSGFPGEPDGGPPGGGGGPLGGPDGGPLVDWHWVDLMVVLMVVPKEDPMGATWRTRWWSARRTDGDRWWCRRRTLRGPDGGHLVASAVQLEGQMVAGWCLFSSRFGFCSSFRRASVSSVGMVSSEAGSSVTEFSTPSVGGVSSGCDSANDSSTGGVSGTSISCSPPNAPPNISSAAAFFHLL